MRIYRMLLSSHSVNSMNSHASSSFTCEDESSPVNIQTPTRVPRCGVFALRCSYATQLHIFVSEIVVHRIFADLDISDTFGRRKDGNGPSASGVGRFPRKFVFRHNSNVGAEHFFTIPNTTGVFCGMYLSYAVLLLKIVFSKENSLYAMYLPDSNTTGNFSGVESYSFNSRYIFLYRI